jgi:hypothetical protein
MIGCKPREWIIEISVAIREMSTYKIPGYWSVGVSEYWEDQLEKKSKTPVLQHSCPNYGDHIQDLEISNYDRFKFIFNLS